MRESMRMMAILALCLFVASCDKDGDGINDNEDNCPEIHNQDQDDRDDDGQGDDCDRDVDGDNVLNAMDNCYFIYNPGQENEDGDNLGDACDPAPNFPGTPDDPESEFWDCRPGARRSCGTSLGECSPGIQLCNSDGYWNLCDGEEPDPEECDNLDNDCDGQVDEDCGECRPGERRPCGISTGECSIGTQICNSDGYWGICDGTSPEPEECDSLDNNCDGTIDEGCDCTPGENRPCGDDMGSCTRGTMVCNADGYWGFCDGTTPQPEICDGLDNNCDGYIDEGLLNLCDECGPIPPETCDMLDNDCDGDIDEGCSCIDGMSQPCGTDLGQCERGTQICFGGRWSTCLDEVRPESESCDGLDNDCDGDFDERCTCMEGMIQSCGSNIGECLSGRQTCDEFGRWGECEGAITERSEICGDGLDNNCNSEIDEDCECTPENVRSCGTDIGMCASGLEVCESGRYWSPCEGATFGDSEICDGEDNDCDDDIDEGCDCLDGIERPCGSDLGQCEYGIQTCVFGRWSFCEGDTRPRAETCDSLDNDCDGSIDEGCECLHGRTRECGINIGDCERGLQECIDGHWTLCDGIMPEAEECDGHDNDCDGDIDEGLLNACGFCGPPPPEECDAIDNDCDGDIDEGCSCLDGEERPCGTDLGTCERGTQTCSHGRWNSCEGDIRPRSESCDAARLDENCNGLINEGCECDEGDSRPCGSNVGECIEGIQSCNDGRWSFDCTGDTVPNSERCNGLDDDCDGTVDEGCDCIDGSARPCGSSMGLCEEGLQTCSSGRWDECIDDVGPDSEICDGLDNDCDGTIDEGLLNRCGECGPPPPERCDGEDNDCDGSVDEGCGCRHGSSRSCGTNLGICSFGSQICTDGTWELCDGIPPESESCDAIDNDCDGAIDEGCECFEGDTRSCGSDLGECVSGEQTCLRGHWDECEDFTGPEPEICDGLDNNCSGHIDEDCFIPPPPPSESTITCLDMGDEVEVTINGDISTLVFPAIPAGEVITTISIGADLDDCWNPLADCFPQPYLEDDLDHVFMFDHTRFTPRVRTDRDSVIYFNLDWWDIEGDCFLEVTPLGSIVNAL